MPENTSNGAPAATDGQGQQPTTMAQTMNDAASHAQGQPAASQSVSEASTAGEQNAQPEIRNPEAYKAAQEAAKWRTQARELEKVVAEFQAAQKAAEEAQLSELEKAQRRIAEYEQERTQVTLQAQERVTRAEVRSEASRLGINPQLAARIVDYAAIEYDENGDPTNIPALLQQAAQDYGITSAASAATAASAAANPTQQQQPRPSAGMPAAPARSATQGGANGGLTREVIERMTVREYQQRRDEVQDWLRTHPNG